MRFDLTSPCKDCPFICNSSTNRSLDSERLKNIANDIRNDMSFTCHKSLDKPKSLQQHCGGALIMLEKENNPNQIMRTAERLRVYDYTKLNMDADIDDTI